MVFLISLTIGWHCICIEHVHRNGDALVNWVALGILAAGIQVEEVSGSEDVQFRVIRYEPELFKHTLMLNYEFPERAGALHEFLEHIKDSANICFFNYKYSGEGVGRSMLGLEFDSADQRSKGMKPKSVKGIALTINCEK